MKQMISIIVLAAVVLLAFSFCANTSGKKDKKDKEIDSLTIAEMKIDSAKWVEKYSYSEPSGMTCYTDDEGNRFTDEGEITLERTADGGMIYRRYAFVKRDTIAVGDEVFEHIGKIVAAYNLEENYGSFTDSDTRLLDVGPWGCSIVLRDGTRCGGSAVPAFFVKDKKRMKKYATFVEGVNEINAYLDTVIKR